MGRNSNMGSSKKVVLISIPSLVIALLTYPGVGSLAILPIGLLATHIISIENLLSRFSKDKAPPLPQEHCYCFQGHYHKG